MLCGGKGVGGWWWCEQGGEGAEELEVVLVDEGGVAQVVEAVLAGGFVEPLGDDGGPVWKLCGGEFVVPEWQKRV